MNDLDVLLPLMKKKGVKLSKESFHAEVNIVFHNIEARTYDKIHADMNNSLQQQFNLIVDDVLQTMGVSDMFRILDIGCGTGLSTEKLLNTKLKSQLSSVYLLDTSSEMLKECKQKAEGWGINYNIIEGYIFTLPEKSDFDIILICSVLHHIPNLKVFFEQINKIVKPGGCVIHLQDPNGDFLNSPEYSARLKDISNVSTKSFSLRKIMDPFFRNIKLKLGVGNLDHIDEVNKELIKRNIITSVLTAKELWSVTDIHVEDLPFSTNKGISFNYLEGILSGYELVKRRSYGFYGRLKSDLPENLKIEEERLISEVNISGRQLACVWLKK
jgi:2-polyprenyl-3-methyl-5-hydroxy-6-metoxy-1,4-benzoquinol methylase